MSANDYLFLTKEGYKYILSHRDADTDAELERWEFDGLEEALARAEEELGAIEYGLVLGLGVKLKGAGKKPNQEKLPCQWEKIKSEELNGFTFSRWWEEGEKELRNFIQSLVEKKEVK